ncbi:expressed unknown protein [Seminavis robusta]|uniref:DUF6973 domain-containing protein n=1 Tax=Seminavis robusta TaxID=568900 RepID=A0A9N8HXU8_9STRA|nr:expressed unknown protein [Seminavis robusta]|eukprot:Sro2582_g331880.1 n/a (295) ;mRNA; r:7561-8536
MKLASFSALISWTLFLCRGHAEDVSRELMGIPGFIVTVTSTVGSKVAWRVIEKDDTPAVQDPNEVTIEFVHATDYADGESRVDLQEGEEYCLRVYKGSNEWEFGPRSGSNTLEVLCSDGIKRTPVKDSRIVVNSPSLEVTCFKAVEDLLSKYPPKLVSCTNGNSWAERGHLVAAIGPYDSWVAKDVSEEAWEVSGDTNLPGEHSGKRDAFRHCYFTCRLTQEIGLEQALEAGDIHESCFFQTQEDQDMDLHNNRVGSELGDGTDDSDECNTGCLQAVEDENLLWLSRRLLRGIQ